MALGARREREPAEVPAVRSLRSSHRRSRVPSGLSSHHAARHRAWRAELCVAARGPARRARGARGAGLPAQPAGAGHELPAHDDLRRVCRRCAITPRSRTSGCRASRPRSTTRASFPAWEKLGNTIGMGMTGEAGRLRRARQHDARATPVGASGPGQLYELVGHKWFFSAPMCDAFLVLAQTDAGVTCFLLPRFAPDGSLNAIRIQRLKDKLGDWSNASTEVEFQGAVAWMIGEDGRGIATILEMVALTRQDCLIGSSGIMRQALVQAVHHARHRRAFGKRLDRAAADAQRARRPRARIGGRGGAVAARRTRDRRECARCTRGGVRAHHDRHRQVLRLQAMPAVRE